MLILGLVILITIILTVILTNNLDSDLGGFAILLSGFIGMGLIFLILITVGQLLDNRTIDDRISLYEQENTQIEQDIDAIVKEYQDYEKGIFDDVEINPTLVVSMYPELKSNELVKAEIEVYVENNKTIKKLKSKQIKLNDLKWVLCFGGEK